MAEVDNKVDNNVWILAVLNYYPKSRQKIFPFINNIILTYNTDRIDNIVTLGLVGLNDR